jgi:hypothetical protein
MSAALTEPMNNELTASVLMIDFQADLTIVPVNISQKITWTFDKQNWRGTARIPKGTSLFP